jgi:hypothetical protein
VTSHSRKEFACGTQHFLDKFRTACYPIDHLDTRTQRTPQSHGGVLEKSDGGRPQHGSQMSDPTVMPHTKRGFLEKERKPGDIRGEKDLYLFLSGKQREKRLLCRPKEDNGHFFDAESLLSKNSHKIHPEIRRMVFLSSARAWVKNNSQAGPMLWEKKRTVRSLLQDCLSINREPALFHGAGKMKSDVNLFVFAGIAWQDINGCALEEGFQVSPYDSLRVFEEGDNFICFSERQGVAPFRNVHKKRMPAWGFEIQTT